MELILIKMSQYANNVISLVQNAQVLTKTNVLVANFQLIYFKTLVYLLALRKHLLMSNLKCANPVLKGAAYAIVLIFVVNVILDLINQEISAQVQIALILVQHVALVPRIVRVAQITYIFLRIIVFLIVQQAFLKTIQLYLALVVLLDVFLVQMRLHVLNVTLKTIIDYKEVAAHNAFFLVRPAHKMTQLIVCHVKIIIIYLITLAQKLAQVIFIKEIIWFVLNAKVDVKHV
ncbi:transmembrane protein, putative (macronuclear) [Tetrahymena thermophila SB210]|uniref:Transmembrane protein, putative n=1 Tax=Tetrahymena thermophila (strain SB210) TaxID=312017 RepID=W7XKR5_TETTS|nr:transmembrane protein, putative [Tetrahymena thermophila SB210]EWS75139.1 transmembrane protein, putative [Tetrahymena thermophila SB210]|eukprot:XP_012652295.1 transmembrane protein, putative [Tetrahymena thermophila SB210]